MLKGPLMVLKRDLMVLKKDWFRIVNQGLAQTSRARPCLLSLLSPLLVCSGPTFRLLSRHYEKTNEKDAKKMKKCQNRVVR